MSTHLLVFGNKNFNNSINEIKCKLEWELNFFNFLDLSQKIPENIDAIIVEGFLLRNNEILNFIKKIDHKPILILHTSTQPSINHFKDNLPLPITLSDLKNKIIKIISSYSFKLNSTILIKKYFLDKNEKKLIKNNIFISLTEREVKLIELFFNEKKSLTKNYILKKVWNYSDSADTHTVETHIYRLRKKIYSKFNDDKFILNSDKGYVV